MLVNKVFGYQEFRTKALKKNGKMTVVQFGVRCCVEIDNEWHIHTKSLKPAQEGFMRIRDEVTLYSCGIKNRSLDEIYCSKASASIVGLKAVVRYLRHNKDATPGNVQYIISRG